jgi:guanosine-3',5'-bis(diphosphate) 3'-pyrophosphohydrolase
MDADNGASRAAAPLPSNFHLFIDALAFAAHKHRDQRRKNVAASPYINHPIALADVLVHEGGITDIDVLCAAILHDTVEDTQTSFDELEARFGAKIAAIVRECTDDKTLPSERRKDLQIEHAPHLSHGAQLVKLADKICNVRDVVDDPPANWPPERRRRYFEWSKRVIDGLRGAHPRLEALFDEAYARGIASARDL